MNRILLPLVCLFLSISSFAVPVSWDGGASTSNWGDALNWSNNLVPTSTDDVTINNATVQVDVSASAYTVTLIGTTVFSVNSGVGLTLGNISGILFNLSGSSTATIHGTVTVNANGSGFAPTVYVNTSGSLTVSSSGSLSVFNFTGNQQEGIGIQAGTLTNNGSITLSTGAIGIGDRGASSFINGSTGTITISGITHTGIRYREAGGAFTNNGAMSISANSGILLDNATNTFDNYGSLSITATTSAIDNAGSGTFNNNTGGILHTVGSGTVGSNRFVNNGGTLAPGASPGFMNFSTSENFNNSTWNIEIADNDGVAGTDYDQIVVQGGGTATLGSTTLNVNFGYTPAINDTYRILNASAISGNFSAINVTPAYGVMFDNTTGFLTVSSLLPVSLVDFKALNQKAAIALIWRTASESNNRGFEIKRSADGKHWHELAFMPGHGTSLEAHDYAYLDEKPLPGTNYYRLLQLDYDGKSAYSPTVSGNVGRERGDIGIFPNPARQGTITLSFLPETPEAVGLLEIFDDLGRQVWQQATQLLEVGKQWQVPLDVSNYAPGTYTVRVASAGGVLTKQLVVVK